MLKASQNLTNLAPFTEALISRQPRKVEVYNYCIYSALLSLNTPNINTAADDTSGNMLEGEHERRHRFRPDDVTFFPSESDKNVALIFPQNTVFVISIYTRSSAIEETQRQKSCYKNNQLCDCATINPKVNHVIIGKTCLI